MQEVQPLKDSFDDSSSRGPKFYGVHANKVWAWENGLAIDLFYYGYEHEQLVYEQDIGKEKRRSLGIRFSKRQGDIQFDYELTYQFGDFAQDDISAWGVATETSVLTTKLDWLNKWGVRMNIASGDNDAQDGELGTYNALFPNAAYVSESAIFAPSNIKDIQPFVILQPTQNLTVFAGIDFLWRASKGDSLYVYPGFPLLTSDVSEETFYGTQFNIIATLKLNDFVNVQGFYTGTNVGSFIKNSGGKNSKFFMVSLGFKF